MYLFDILKKKGYSTYKEPNSFIDSIAAKFSIIRIFYKPKYIEHTNILQKGDIQIVLDLYFPDIDIYIKNKRVKSFSKDTESSEILKYLKHIEREIKLKRVLK